MFTVHFYNCRKVADFRRQHRDLFWRAVDALHQFRLRHDPLNGSRLLAYASVCDTVIVMPNPQKALERLIATDGRTCLTQRARAHLRLPESPAAAAPEPCRKAPRGGAGTSEGERP